MKSLDAIAIDLRERLDLPAGYVVEVDRNTHNLIVRNDRLGFCVTNQYLADHPHAYLSPIAEQLAALKAATGPMTTALGGISTLEQIEADREGVTAFDR